VGSSETIRGEIVNNIKAVTSHVPVHHRPANDVAFGYYLAGLIDGDGHFSTQQQLVITFSTFDAPLAYYVKARLGFGNICKAKNKSALTLVVSAYAGIEKVISLIAGKLRTTSRFDQVVNNILRHPRYRSLKFAQPFTRNQTADFENHWLAGFTDVNGSFQVELLIRSPEEEVRLSFQIDQKTAAILLLIREHFGGNIGYRAKLDAYHYNSTCFGSARNVINYFDRFHLLSSKQLNFLK
jgi:hypothetical protein